MLGRLFSFVIVGLLLAAGAAHAQGKPELQWFAQSAFKLTTPGGKVIMIDPWITGNPKTPPEYKDLDKLGKIDLILVTHAHGDHLGDAVELAKKNNAPMLGTAGMDQTLQTLGILPASSLAAHEQVAAPSSRSLASRSPRSMPSIHRR